MSPQPTETWDGRPAKGRSSSKPNREKTMKPNTLKMATGYEAAFKLIDALLIAMDRKGLTRSQLAKAMKKNRSTVTKWFSPTRNLTIYTAAQIAHALGAELRFEVVPREAPVKLADAVMGNEQQEVLKGHFAPVAKVLSTPGDHVRERRRRHAVHAYTHPEHQKGELPNYDAAQPPRADRLPEFCPDCGCSPHGAYRAYCEHPCHVDPVPVPKLAEVFYELVRRASDPDLFTYDVPRSLLQEAVKAAQAVLPQLHSATIEKKDQALAQVAGALELAEEYLDQERTQRMADHVRREKGQEEEGADEALLLVLGEIRTALNLLSKKE